MTSKGGHAGPLCPSAGPQWRDSVAIGVVGGTAEQPRVRHLEEPIPVTPELLALAEPVEPTEVFRFAAPCLGRGCGHFGESRCRLASKVVRMLPTAVDDLPACQIRPRCRWFLQEGADACLRCPLVATHDANPSPAMRAAADPTTS
jgi:hypothetical protein